jgi:hypothetical protein
MEFDIAASHREPSPASDFSLFPVSRSKIGSNRPRHAQQRPTVQAGFASADYTVFFTALAPR